MKYFLNGTWCNDSTITELPAGATLLSDTEWDNRQARPAGWLPEPPSYQELRASAYPPAADYLDAIVKGDTAQAQAYIDECLAVKAKYPK
jgi:hypothetical protein